MATGSNIEDMVKALEKDEGYKVLSMHEYASVYMCFVVTCWERADLLALVCGVFCEFVTFPLVSWVRCGT